MFRGLRRCQLLVPRYSLPPFSVQVPSLNRRNLLRNQPLTKIFKNVLDLAPKAALSCKGVDGSYIN